MKNLDSKKTYSGVFVRLSLMLLGLVVLATTGCKTGSQDSGDGVISNDIVLPTDTNLTLACENVGIYTETCIEDDPANPYRNVGISEFDDNTEEEGNKFALNDAIPPGPTGAKARFYLWATALARRSGGENQWYTARALHEVWSAQPIKNDKIREQALRAYESILQNYFGSVTFFDFVDPPISVQLNQWVGFDLLCPIAILNDLFARPFPAGKSFIVEGLLADWGFTYIAPSAFTGLNAGGMCDAAVVAEDGLLFVNVF